MALSDTVKSWGRDLGRTIKQNSSKSSHKKYDLAKKVSKKMVNRNEEGHRVPDADRNRGD